MGVCRGERGKRNLGFRLIYHRAALKFLARQENAVQRRIMEALAGLLADPLQGDICPLKKQPGAYRLRVGTYRVIFIVDRQNGEITIRTVDNRGDIY